jgi:ornithine cyclodeaminase/alanine dehydrogenase-like protein (mu-crystallin family)
VHDIRREAAEAFGKEMTPVVKEEIVIVDSPEAAAREADVLVTMTTSRDPFLREAWVTPGAVVLLLGSYQECEDARILTVDKLMVDHVGQCLPGGRFAFA